MITTTIWIWIASGAIISGPIPLEDCARNIAVAEAAIASGGMAELEGPDVKEIIVRMQCDGLDVVLALPPATGICELGETS